MSASPEEREEDGAADEEMMDMGEFQSPTDNHGDSFDDDDDEATVRGTTEGDHLADIVEEARQDVSTPDIGGNGVVNRYREILHEEQEAPSDNGSTDALPRRAGSPVDSMLSGPDDTPSIPVCCRCMGREPGLY